ncbi:bifunctional polyketide synthase/nonribosomal peptide synthetase phmA [Parastagonospora nodorum]|nr:bifunctional polyketide synthase/nonribosomal peptide synthetase phmA [Parastagonospora nodorum]KAH4073206.1 bifunctional polyketide synthase/nonribosomal peptide synthetase phmA [Parastagonospora nodorum]KAH4099737.1 bifunctional polyketide synthase/nonribosomal peptide synthetase phmA [Parastagonospora nodorum]KAH4213081.1 bifunctional polyketide synthase/nonribosomal peptide synthetase phmA [Parastagonospora nodorum]KAH4422243.1 bifunctional polyketide synthase/nonribosomal peptide synthe
MGSSSKDYTNEPIAIVGSACRFPGGASEPSKLWDLLEHPTDVLKEIPESRFSVDGFYHPNGLHHGTTNVRHSYILDDDIRLFDAQFFGIKPIEANSIDPQQRLLMETVYEGLEAAGQSIQRLQGSQTAVYVGLMSSDYKDLLGNDQESYPTYFATGTAASILSNRVSYFFDWHGPSMTIDTACSSSLVALHQAVQLLRSGDGTNVALAAGTNLLLNPDQYIAESKLKMLSPDGRSRMWDEKANGYARGDGIAVVVLKRLSQALEDGDHIECLIRETQINQDGKTKGITMPSATAQTALIRATYAKAGLDLSKPSDRPQYFEAHGTGTPAGDPIEAEAIHTAFFGGDLGEAGHDKLFVGSIKTVIGHTEGTAGLAAVLKASLALQNRAVPPNRLFDRLNSKIRPFYGDLEILTKAQEWPVLVPGSVARASVNSFGFGGANAHAILEAYEPPSLVSDDVLVTPLAPVQFSAASETALRGTLRKHAEFLEKNQDVNLRDLAWTLNTRRSVLAARTAVFGANALDLAHELQKRAEADVATLIPVASRSLPAKPRILGVFTGQGAQWARMGAELLDASPAVDRIISELEKSLSTLPDGPEWSVKGEILATGGATRVAEAAISQPLCTAVQIVLVDLLKSAGINFEAVVGHSSGEMGAAYAAGYLSAQDAIRVAYYRGRHLHLAGGLGGEQGGMMAVGTSFEDAEELCSLPEFQGRIGVAAINSGASVTLSGDLDTIEAAKEILDDEKKFARLLKVDKAYHSHHMIACSDAYRKSLADCSIKVLRPSRGSATWLSSVYGEDIVDYRKELTSEYWINNMVRPVLFSQAVEFAAAEKGPFDCAIEVGPHPALKGPALQVLQEFLGDSIPYTGLLSRGRDDKKAFAEGLGYLWQAFGENAIDHKSFDTFVAGASAPLPQITSNLPTYAWDHDRRFWHESRQYAANRTKPDPTHELLGTKCPDGTEQQCRWRNMLRPQEIPWLAGHQIQGQMVFPAAGYVSAAVEAVKFSNEGLPITTIEIEDFVIGQAIIFNDDYASVETQFTLTNIVSDHVSWSASFAFYSASQKHSLGMDLNASGRISALFGPPKDDVLPPSTGRELNMIDVDPEQFYNSLSKLGFGYTGAFKALRNLYRKMDVAMGEIQNPRSTDPAYNLLLHPATFDNAIQSIILAYCYPGDGRLWSVHLPTSIKKIRINPSLCENSAGQEAVLHFKSTITSGRSTEIQGDVELYDTNGVNSIMQLEGLHTKPLGHATPENDRTLFLETIWDTAEPTKELALLAQPDISKKAQLGLDIERVAFYYIRNLGHVTTKADREQAEDYHKHFFNYIDHTVFSVSNGTSLFAKKEWMHDTHEQVLDIIKSYPESIDMKLMYAVGEHLLPVIRHETTMLEYMREDDMLNDFYVKALGFDEYTETMADQVCQLAHRYPHMNVLEIGAGTGGATKRIFKKLGKRFGSYTYTDISTGFFEKAREVFSEVESKMTFKALNIEKDPIAQGYTEGSYDLIVASLVLHATHVMEDTMRNVRRLLKPGGYLIMLELGDYVDMRTGLMFGPLPGWWMGYDDGRKLSPTMSEDDWDKCMKKVGFSGVDAIVPRQEHVPISLAIMTAQAVDEHVEFIRNPFASDGMFLLGHHLTLIGGSTDKTAKLLEATLPYLRSFYKHVTTVKSLASLSTIELPFMGSVICLEDLDVAVFENLSTETLQGVQHLFTKSKSCLWVTQGRKDDNPYQNMTVGLGRVATLEMTHLRLQSLDFDVIDSSTAVIMAKSLLRFEATEAWEQQGLAKNLLWSVEPEMSYEKGSFRVPRLIPNHARNNRYNSSRRLITQNKDPRTSTIGLRWTSKGYEIHHESPASSGLAFDGRVELQVSHSSLEAIRITKADYAYLVLGTNLRTKEQAFAITPDRHSIVRVFDSWTVPYTMTTEEALRLLPLVQDHLMALATMSDFSSGEALILIEPRWRFARLLSNLAQEKGVKLILLTTRLDIKDQDWITLHPNAPRRIIQSHMPKTASRLISCTDDLEFEANVKACLPPNCKMQRTEIFSSRVSKLDSFSSMAFIPSSLRSAFVRAHHESSPGDKESIASVSDIVSRGKPAKATFFSWDSSPTIPVQITPVDLEPLFSSDKTYWLVGLTGGLGLSLCEWMIQRGAKYVVLTSRNPQVDAKWEAHMKAHDAVVRIYANDVTDRDSVRSVYKQIRDELPPIGGVAQGAMVLSDAMFVDMGLERVCKVMEPKVKGAIHLEELFSEADLDFFVFFSSMAYVTGNQGQSIYAAANAYMAALAAQRKKRGLAGSVINIGAIVGNGYVTRQLTDEQRDYLAHMGNVFMSEQDFHQIFAEGVVAGRPGNDDIPEIMTGLGLAHMDDSDKVTWFNNPKFSHCVLWPDDQGAAVGMSKQNVTVKSRLLLATTADEVNEAIQESFTMKLRSSLQIEDSVAILKMNAEELGLDSLVAVDLRSWFVKELNVEMPVLKILGGFTVAELVSAAQEQLPASLTPNFGKEIDPALKAAAMLEKAAKTETVPRITNEANTAAYREEVDEEEQEEDEADNRPNFFSSASKDATQSSERFAIDASHISKSREVAFKATLLAPPATRSKTSSSSSSFTSDPENDFMMKSQMSAATPLSSYNDEYITAEDIKFERVSPMSFGQARFWFLKFYLQDQTTFNITTSIRLSGRLNVETFANAVQAVGRRHEGLRTAFFTDRHNQPMQGILHQSVLHLEHLRVSSQEAIDIEYAKTKNHVYNIGGGETMKIILLSLADDLYQIIIGYHHINMDGMSLEVILSDLQKVYNQQQLARVVPQYLDFSESQRREHSTGKWGKEISFWKGEFADIPAPLPILPMSKKSNRSPLTKYASNTVKFKIDAATSAQIQIACKRAKASPFNFYLAAFKTLLYRTAGEEQNDICIGIADGGRNSEHVEESVGFFLNILPLRFKQDSAQTFLEALRDARSKVVAALANSRVPFDVILNEVNAPRAATHNPLFQAFINYRQGVQERRQFCGCDSEATQFDGSQTAYDISIDILANPGADSTVYISGQSDLYSEENVKLLAHSYLALIKSFAKNPASRLGRPPLYDPQDTHRALDVGVGPELTDTWPNTLVDRVDEMASRFGSQIALKGPRNQLTYSQMTDRIHSIASSLKSNKIGNCSRVGVLQDPSTDFFCSLLAILRIGAIFVPLELRLTSPRLAVIVEDSNIDAIIYDKANQKDLLTLGSGFQKVNVSLIPAKSTSTVVNEAQPGSPAVILYTSGSTGKPKGILLSHASWRNQIQSSTQAFRIPQGTGVHLQQSSWSFDIAISQTFVALANGASLLIVSKELRGDSIAMARMIVSDRITHVQATPSEMVSWLHDADANALRSSSWKFAMSGGEKMNSALIGEFKALGKSDLALVNAYGPAETTLAVGSAEIDILDPGALDTAFRLFPNYSVYILDSKKQPVPLGISGEVYIGGAGVATGYLNNDNLTKERFLPDDFAPERYLQNDWTIMHRSGDRGRLTADGLVLEGRVDGDTQIKLRGIRIDLQDIESTIVQHSKGAVRDAVVSLRKSGETQILAAHIVLSAAFSGNAKTILDSIQTSLPLPQYMRPATTLVVETLPTNYSGKLDRKAVSELPLRPVSKTSVPVTKENKSPESELRTIWKQVLGDDITSSHEIDYETDFFHVGGNSLALVRVQGMLKAAFNVEPPVAQLFDNSTLGAMLNLISPASQTMSTEHSSLLPNVVEYSPQAAASSGTIDWEKETALTDDLYDAEINPTPRDQGLAFKTVAITGASGFLGKEILKRMVDDVHIDKIHAIAIRRHISDLPAIFSNAKVQVHRGDLNAPRLGLSETRAKEIFDETDTVIHNGADVSFLKTYKTLSKTNVGSTRELVKLCLPSRIPIHFISSASVAHLSGRASFGEESVSEYEPPQDGSDGYTATKWASERFLELVSEKFSIPVWIHRPSSITGAEAPALDLMTNLLQFSKTMSKVPYSPTWSGTLDFVSVESVAHDIVEEVKNDSAHSSGMVRFMYESGDLEIAVQDMQGSLAKQTGEEFDKVDVETWTREAVSEGLDELVAAYLSTAANLPIMFPRLIRDNKRRRIEQKVQEQPSRGSSLREVVGRWLWSRQ